MKKKKNDKFLEHILGAQNDKRTIMYMSFTALVGMIILSAFDKQLDKNLIYVFAGLTTGESILNYLNDKNN